MAEKRTTDINLPNDTGEVDPRLVKSNRETERIGKQWMTDPRGFVREQGRTAVNTAREQRKKWPQRAAGRK